MKFTGISAVSPINIEKFMSFYHFKFTEGYKGKGEFHNFPETVYVVSGNIGVATDREYLRIGPGGLIFHKAGEYHRLWAEDGTAPEIFVFSYYTESEFIKNFENKVYYLDGFEKSLIVKLATLLESKVVCHGDDGRHTLCFKDEVTEKTLRLEKSIFETLLLQIVGNKTADAIAMQSLKSHEEIFSAALKFMNANICVSLRESDICANVGVSSATLKRIFKKYTSGGSMKYFTAMKINRAIAMLNDGVPVGEVSYRLGFSSQNYFCTVMKRETGKSPSEYKRDL